MVIYGAEKSASTLLVFIQHRPHARTAGPCGAQTPYEYAIEALKGNQIDEKKQK
jgi:hypothetical protein